jgi:hypothetical protein
MSLFAAMPRPRVPRPGDPVEDLLGSMVARLDPDPLFVRRLRSEALNRYVLAREYGAPLERPAGRGEMGRVGRASLFASIVLAATTMSALAASEEALPGDPLYGLKLQIEQVRLDLFPAHLDDDLAAISLAQRIEEMGRLTEAGKLDAAIAMLPAIEEAYLRLAEHPDVPGPSVMARVERRLAVLEALIGRLPAGAQAAVQGLIERVGDGDATGEAAAPRVDVGRRGVLPANIDGGSDPAGGLPDRVQLTQPERAPEGAAQPTAPRGGQAGGAPEETAQPGTAHGAETGDRTGEAAEELPDSQAGDD